MFLSMLAVAAGASAGAIGRWLLGLGLNQLFPAMPPGTLAANWIACYIMGVAMAVFACWPGLGQGWKLLVMTGFLGGLSTMSTFSAEVIGLLHHGRLSMAGAAIALHVAGSLFMTWLGLASFELWRKF